MKIFRGSLAFVIILIFVCSIAFSCVPVFSQSNIEDIDNQDNNEDDNKVNDTSANGNTSLNQNMIPIVIELYQRIYALENERDLVVKELLQSQLSNESKDQLIYELENNILNMQVYIHELNQMILDLQLKNLELQNYISILEEIRNSLLQSVYALNQQIELLHSEMLNTRFVCTFMFDDNIYSVVLTPINGKIEIENPISTEYTIFLGWSLSQDGELIDLETFEVQQDTIFYAKIIRKYDVNFMYENQTYIEKRLVEKGNTITTSGFTLISPLDTDRKIFLGWANITAPTTIIDPCTVDIFEHTTFIAVVETRYLITFAYKRDNVVTNISTQYQSSSSNISIPTAPVFQGYTFSGWTLNGQSISNPKTIVLNGDLIFFAKYTANEQVATLPNEVKNGTYTYLQNRIHVGSSSSGVKPVIVDRVFINLDSYMNNNSPLGSLTCTIEIQIGANKINYDITIASVIDVRYHTNLEKGAKYEKWYSVYHKSKEPAMYKSFAPTSGAYLGANVIIFDIYVVNQEWYEYSWGADLIDPDNALVSVKSVKYKYVDNFVY